uniref:Amino_oxidase domain-containing protein n=1 Tax=Rhabditophanes sp. KR3021 TaxID=114890 RepID=A0AC35TNQ8_9BILA
MRGSIFFLFTLCIGSIWMQGDDVKRYDVVIIGGGMTGLAAMHEIQKTSPQTSVLLLEASNSTGGRVRGIKLLRRHYLIVFYFSQSDWATLPGAGQSVAALSSPNTFTQLVSINVETFTTNYPMTTSTKDGIFRTLQTFFDSPADKISALQLMLTLNSESEDIQTFLTNQGHGGSLVMKESLSALASSMTTGKTINYNEYVTSIHILDDEGSVIPNNTVSGSQVYITTDNGQHYLAKEVIVAVSPSQINNIAFDPPMNQSQSEFYGNYTAQGDAYYFVASFETTFWRKNNKNGQLIFSDQTGTNPLYWLTTFDISPNDTCQSADATPGVLYGLAHFTGNFTFEQRKTAYISVFKSQFGESDANSLIDIQDIQWIAQKYIQGTVGVIPVDGIESLAQLTASPFADRIHFASPELSVKSMGTTNGAVVCGQQVATTVLDELKSLPTTPLRDTGVVVGGLVNNNVTTEITTTQPPTTFNSTQTVDVLSTTTANSVGNTTSSDFVYHTSTQYPETTETSVNNSATTSSEVVTSTANPIMMNDDGNSTTQFPYSTSTHYPVTESSTVNGINETHSTIIVGSLLTDINSTSTLSFESTTLSPLFNVTNSSQLVESTTIQISLNDESNNSTSFVYSTSTHYPTTENITSDITSTTSSSFSPILIFNDQNNDTTSSNQTLETTTAFNYETSSHYPQTSTSTTLGNNVLRDDPNQGSTLTTQSPTETTTIIVSNSTEQINVSSVANNSTEQMNISSTTAFPYHTSSHYSPVIFPPAVGTNCSNSFASTIFKDDPSSDDVMAMIHKIQADIPNVSQEDRLELISQLNLLISNLVTSIQKDELSNGTLVVG